MCPDPLFSFQFPILSIHSNSHSIQIPTTHSYPPLIHSLVEGGTAERDGQLKVGDHLVHVNHTPVYNKPLEFAVEQLISVPMGSVAVIGVNHPLPVSPDVVSNPCSPLSRESFFSDGDDYGGIDGLGRNQKSLRTKLT